MDVEGKLAVRCSQRLIRHKDLDQKFIITGPMFSLMFDKGHTGLYMCSDMAQNRCQWDLFFLMVSAHRGLIDTKIHITTLSNFQSTRSPVS